MMGATDMLAPPALRRVDTARQGPLPMLRSLLLPPWSGLDDEALRDGLGRRVAARFDPRADTEHATRAQADAVLARCFDYCGEVHRLGDPIDWLENPSEDIEWHILLHKFYFAVALGFAFRETRERCYLDGWIELTESWITQTPPDFIATDVTGRRVQNWVYAWHCFATDPSAPIPPAFQARFFASLHAQVEHLCANLHPGRNHRTLELAAIFLAAVAFPELRSAALWREFALAEIVRNIDTDLLPDGVHCELSTDYHHLVLRNFLSVRELARRNGIAFPAGADRRLQRALDFALHARRPDGFVPSFSDGDVHDYGELLDQGDLLFGRPDLRYSFTRGAGGTAPPARVAAFPDAGYYFARSGWGEHGDAISDERYLAFDCGALGAGNHGHLDVLSVELAAFGHPLVVDPGRFTYHEGGDINWRVVFRGTAAHNTVQVDGREQTRYEPGPNRYRIRGPAPAATLIDFVSTAQFDLLHGEARSFEYDVVHERRIAFVAGSYWIVSDTLRAPERHVYDLRWHLSDEAEGRTDLSGDAAVVRVQAPHVLLLATAGTGTRAALDTGFVSRRYGEKLPAPVLRLSRTAAATTFHTVIVPFAGGAPQVVVAEGVPATGDGSGSAGVVRRTLVVRIGEGGPAHTDTWSFTEWHAEAGEGRPATADWTFERHDSSNRCLIRIDPSSPGLRPAGSSMEVRR